jgi:hypothetical protein
MRANFGIVQKIISYHLLKSDFKFNLVNSKVKIKKI